MRRSESRRPISSSSAIHEVFDGGRKVAFGEIQVNHSGRDTQIRVPLAILQQPHRVLATTQMRVGPVPLEWMSWRILEIDAATVRSD